jgi:glutaredoxin
MSLAFFRRWFASKPRQRPDLVFLLYTRAACPLCDDAHELLTHYQKQFGFVMETKDVDESEQLTCDFGNCVPVVAVNGKVRFRGHINEVLLRRILDAAH